MKEHLPRRNSGVRRIVLSASLLLAPNSVFGAGFECVAVKSAVEQQICQNARLSALDDELNAVYQQARKLTPDTTGLREGQTQWIKEVRDACQEEGCLEAAYLFRIEQIKFDPAFKKQLFARQSPPKEIFGRYTKKEKSCFAGGPDGYECDGTVENYLTVKPAGGNAVDVDTTLYFFNGHECSLASTGEWVGGELRVPEFEEASDKNCVLLIRFKDGQATTDDPWGNCKDGHCGARGGFHDYTLKKTSPGGKTRQDKVK